jgi:hypothetical protein
MARVHAFGGNAYGCVGGAARSYLLGTTRLNGVRVDAVSVVGRIAAYELVFRGVDFGTITVNHRRLTTGVLLAHRPATTMTGVQASST